MPVWPRAAALAASLSAGAAGLACNLDVPPASYIHTTTLISLDLEVVTLGPLFPERDAALSLGPFVEPLPGDRLRVSPVVVDPDGRRLEDRVLDVLRVTQAACALESIQCSQVSYGRGEADGGEDRGTDELVIARLIRTKGWI